VPNSSTSLAAQRHFSAIAQPIIHQYRTGCLEMAETYLEVEAWIQSAYEALLNAEKQNIAATAREFDIQPS